MKFNKLKLAMSFALITGLTACGSDDERTSVVETPVAGVTLTAFDADGVLEAQIRRTQFGIPHIEADNLESLAYGSGYVQAQDNLCVLADGFVKANSERSLYFGPHTLDFTTFMPAAEDNANVISDFAYKAMRIRELAEAKYEGLSDNAKALVNGFTQGYNRYVNEVKQGEHPTAEPFCAAQPWLKEIDGVDYLTYLFSVTSLPGAGNPDFRGLLFFANPNDGEEYLPRIVVPEGATVQNVVQKVDQKAAQNSLNNFEKNLKQGLTEQMLALKTPETNGSHLGSNGWALGSEKTENGMGMVLVNPHFPHTGNLRFWQSHLTIPGELNVMGGALIGMPGLINIGFNDNLAWTHTFSTAEHFVVYDLEIDPNADGRMNYLFDGASMPITEETVSIQVNVGAAAPITLEKEIYYTDKGPLIEAPAALAPFGWSDQRAFLVQDVNMGNTDPIDHWLAMNSATNLAQFQQSFKDYDGMIFNNTMYADKAGHAFYIDDSAVPHLSSTALGALGANADLIAAKKAAGFTILPGNSSVFAFSGSVPYESVPKLLRTDYVLNSNDSYWATNLQAPLAGYSSLYGSAATQLSMRTRMNYKMLDDAAGDDGLFNLDELTMMATNNRAYLPEAVLEPLLAQCAAQGDTPVMITEAMSYDVSTACAALSQWNGAQNADSIGGALIREFAHQFDEASMFAVPFDVNRAATTPNTLVDDGSALIALAKGAMALDAAGIALASPLGAVQFVERSFPDGTQSDLLPRLPWGGAHHAEGGFNIFATHLTGDDTLLPQHSYAGVLDPDRAEEADPKDRVYQSGLTEQGYQIRYGSSFMMTVGFEESGPKANALLTFSQSNNLQSDYFMDQSVSYAQGNGLLPLPFTEAEIEASLIAGEDYKLSSAE